MIFGETVKLFDSANSEGFLENLRVEGSLRECKYDMTDRYFKESLTIKDEQQKNRFLKIRKLRWWRPFEKVIEKIKEMGTTGRY